jgi:Uma2 family endonuclease
MTKVSTRLTLEEYLAYEDAIDNRYELLDRKLILIPPKTDRNNLIALYLLAEFLKLVPMLKNNLVLKHIAIFSFHSLI